MRKPDIVTSNKTAQGNIVNRDDRKDTVLFFFKGMCEETEVHVFDVRRALAIDALYFRNDEWCDGDYWTYLQKLQKREEVYGRDEGYLPTKDEDQYGGWWSHPIKGPGGRENIRIKIRKYVNRLTIMKNGLKVAYSLGWGKCNNAARIKLPYLPGFDQARDDYYVIVLVKLIQGETFNFKKQIYIYDSMNNIQQKNCWLLQRRGWNLTVYLDKYLAQQMAVEKFGGKMGNDPGVIVHELALI